MADGGGGVGGWGVSLGGSYLKSKHFLRFDKVNQGRIVQTQPL